MSWLFLDTHTSGQYRLGMCHRDGKTDIRLYKGRTRSALTRIHRLWEKEGKEWSGIAVVSGPGSFSSIRTGVLYANILATCLHLPLQGLSVEESTEDETIIRILKSDRMEKEVSYVAPVYDAEPNITLPRTS